MKHKFSLIIRWSDEDQCYIAWIPELGTGVKTHGESYEEAARRGTELVESFNEPYLRPGEEVPDAWTYGDSEKEEQLGKLLFPENPNYGPPKRLDATKAKHAAT